MRWLLTLCVVSTSFSLAAQENSLETLRAYKAAGKLNAPGQSFGDMRSLVNARGLSETDKQALHTLATEMTLAYAASHKDEWAPVAFLTEVAPAGVAEKALTSWLRSSPTDVSALSARATLRARQKRYDDAIADLEKLIALDPEDASRHFEVGSTLLDVFLEDKTTDPVALSRAIARTEVALRRARELQPAFGPATMHLGGLLELKSRLTDGADEKSRLKTEAEMLQREGMAQLRKSGAKLFNVALLSVSQGARSWSVNDRDVLLLERAPFSIELKIGQSVPVLLNVHDSDVVQRATDRGFRLDKACTPSGAFCPANFVKEKVRNADERVVSSARSSHHLYFKSESDHAWSEADPSGLGSYKRVVAKIGDVPVAATKEKALYFTLVLDRDADGVLGALEPLRFTIKF